MHPGAPGSIVSTVSRVHGLRCHVLPSQSGHPGRLAALRYAAAWPLRTARERMASGRLPIIRQQQSCAQSHKQNAIYMRAAINERHGSGQAHAMSAEQPAADRSNAATPGLQPICIGTSPDQTALVRALLKALFASPTGHRVVVALDAADVPAAVRILATATNLARRRKRCIVFQAVGGEAAEQTLFYVQMLEQGWPIDPPQPPQGVLVASSHSTPEGTGVELFKAVDAHGTAAVHSAGGPAAATVTAALILARNSLLAYRPGKDFCVHVLPDRQLSRDGRGAQVHVLLFVLLACAPGRPANFEHWLPAEVVASPGQI